MEESFAILREVYPIYADLTDDQIFCVLVLAAIGQFSEASQGHGHNEVLH